MRSLSSIIKADYLQRARSYAFLVTLLASVALAYAFLPAPEANYSTVRVGEYVGENNAAWMGHVTAIMSSTFLWLIGFYLVNNGIKRDRDTGVGQIIATTSVSNFKYLLAKAFSNFLVLLTIVLIVMLIALGVLFYRGSDHPFSFSQFFLPYLLATIPSVFFVGALAVFMEVIFGKYTTLLNIAFFFMFGIIVSIVNTGNGTTMNWLDVMGTKTLTDGMSGLVNATHTDSLRQVSVGFIFGGISKKKFFLFEGSTFTSGYIIIRFSWMVIALLLVFISAKLFHRFDDGQRVAVKEKKKLTDDIIEEKHIPKDIHLHELPVAAPALGILPFVKTEFLLLIRKGPKWFWLITFGGFIALFFIPLKLAHQFGLPAIWFLQINRWADIATKEKFFGTHYFTYAAFKPLQRLLTSQVLSGWILATILALPLIIRYAMIGDLSTVTTIIIGAIFVISFAVFSGIITGGKRFFEIVYFMLVYCNLSSLPFADYFGAFNHGMNYILVLLSVILLMLHIAFIARAYEIRNQ
jgi:hypothetical protein